LDGGVVSIGYGTSEVITYCRQWLH